jgi:hypothetical protein
MTKKADAAEDDSAAAEGGKVVAWDPDEQGRSFTSSNWLRLLMKIS